MRVLLSIEIGGDGEFAPCLNALAERRQLAIGYGARRQGAGVRGGVGRSRTISGHPAKCRDSSRTEQVAHPVFNMRANSVKR